MWLDEVRRSSAWRALSTRTYLKSFSLLRAQTRLERLLRVLIQKRALDAHNATKGFIPVKGSSLEAYEICYEELTGFLTASDSDFLFERLLADWRSLTAETERPASPASGVRELTLSSEQLQVLPNHRSCQSLS